MIFQDFFKYFLKISDLCQRIICQSVENHLATKRWNSEGGDLAEDDPTEKNDKLIKKIPEYFSRSTKNNNN